MIEGRPGLGLIGVDLSSRVENRAKRSFFEKIIVDSISIYFDAYIAHLSSSRK